MRDLLASGEFDEDDAAHRAAYLKAWAAWQIGDADEHA